MRLFPVAALFDRNLRGRERIQEARRSGAIALARSAALANAPFAGGPIEFPTDPDGVPQPLEGWSWSLSHTRGLVAGAVAPRPVGIDVEWLGRSRWHQAYRWFMEAAPQELELLGGESPEAVLSLWTAKEAVLKRAGVGLADLTRCPLVGRLEEDVLHFRHRGTDLHVRRTFFGEHVLALAYEGPFEFELASLPELVA